MSNYELVFTPASQISIAWFLLVVFLVIGSSILGVYSSSRRLGYRASRRTWGIVLAWLLYLGICTFVVESGFLQDQVLPRLPIFFAALMLLTVAFVLSPWGRQLALGVPLGYLVFFQAFRLPLELVLHSWAAQGTVPLTMTWTGANWDILSGLIAIIVLPLIERWRQAAWVANILGFLLLLNVIRVAIFSAPLPFSWNVIPPLQLAFHSPYFLIGPVCVCGALAGHLILTMSLLKKSK